jgi:hypothetical protein
MNESISQFLLRTSTPRWFSSPLNRLRPPPNHAMAWSLALAHALYIAGMVGLALGFVSRLATGRWYFAPFALPAAYGFLLGILWASLVRAAWNRRARSIQRPEHTEPSSPIPVPQGVLCRLLPAVYLLTFLVAGLALCFSLENLRGSLVLKSFRNELRARGEPVTPAEVIPPPVPDAQNLAMAPLLRPLFELERTESGTRPADSNAWRRAKSIVTQDPKQSFRAFASGKARNDPTFDQGRSIDLAMWQAYYQSLTHWPQLPADTIATPAKSVLHALSRYDAEFSELRSEVESRPLARFPLDYDRLFAMDLPHLSTLKATSIALSLRASAYLADDRPDEALSDVVTLTRLSGALKPEPLIVSHLVRFAIHRMILQVVWEGCLDRRWSEDQLKTLEGLLGAQSPIEEIRYALRGERVFGSAFFANIAQGTIPRDVLGDPASSELHAILRVTPRGWVHLNEVIHGRYMLALTDAASAAQSHRDIPPKGSLLTEHINLRSPFSSLASLLAPALDPTLDRAFEQEAWRRLALVGLALEHHRTMEGEYPQQLSSLAPRYLESVPADIMDGQPLRYSRREDGDFHLYSVGTDHRDDGGTRAERKARTATGPKLPSDWVWR